jgi:hypothetical protein
MTGRIRATRADDVPSEPSQPNRDSELLRLRLEAIRATVLARAERRLRGLTTTERDLLESTTVEFVDEVARALAPSAVHWSGGDEGDQ